MATSRSFPLKNAAGTAFGPTRLALAVAQLAGLGWKTTQQRSGLGASTGAEPRR